VLVVPERLAGSMELAPLQRRTLVSVWAGGAACLRHSLQIQQLTAARMGSKADESSTLMSMLIMLIKSSMQREGLNEVEEVAFDFHRQRFVYSAKENCFKKLEYPTKVGGRALCVHHDLFLSCLCHLPLPWAVDTSAWSQAMKCMPSALNAISSTPFHVPLPAHPDRRGMAGPSQLQGKFGDYMKATGLGNELKVLSAHDKYGLNMFEVPIPAFMALLKDHLVAPFFCFQVSTMQDRLNDYVKHA
jgi:hypothetical protein